MAIIWLMAMMSSGQYLAYASVMTNPPPSRSLDKFIVRFPEGMRDRLAEAAELSGRSMNSEIVHRLQASFPTIEGEMSARRAEELRKLQNEMGATGAEYHRLHRELKSLEAKFGIKDLAADVRTRDLYKQLEAVGGKCDLLGVLSKRIHEDIELLNGPRGGETVERAPVVNRRRTKA